MEIDLLREKRNEKKKSTTRICHPKTKATLKAVTIVTVACDSGQW
jgi:hypothetical protein